MKVDNNTLKPKDDNCGVSFWVFFAALFAILLVSVLANIWIRVINNLAFNYFNINQDSFWWTLLVALILTGIFVGYIFLAFDEDNGNALRTRIVGLNFGGSVVANSTNISPESTDTHIVGSSDSNIDISGTDTLVDNSGPEIPQN
jgi:hypothetical protein